MSSGVHDVRDDDVDPPEGLELLVGLAVLRALDLTQGEGGERVVDVAPVELPFEERPHGVHAVFGELLVVRRVLALVGVAADVEADLLGEARGFGDLLDHLHVFGTEPAVVGGEVDRAATVVGVEAAPALRRGPADIGRGLRRHGQTNVAVEGGDRPGTDEAVRHEAMGELELLDGRRGLGTERAARARGRQQIEA